MWAHLLSPAGRWAGPCPQELIWCRTAWTQGHSVGSWVNFPTPGKELLEGPCYREIRPPTLTVKFVY